MSYLRESIREKWDWVLSFFHDPTPVEMDEVARGVIRNEIEYLNQRRIRLEKLLAEPERLRNRKIAEQMAEEMHQNLEAKRRNPPALTEAELLQQFIWRSNLTPKEKCRHLKGGVASRWGVDKYGGPGFRTEMKDYNLGCHTFVDGKTKIWCLNGCGFVSWNGDENWAKAKEMMDSSTNLPSSSEQAPK